MVRGKKAATKKAKDGAPAKTGSKKGKKAQVSFLWHTPRKSRAVVAATACVERGMRASFLTAQRDKEHSCCHSFLFQKVEYETYATVEAPQKLVMLGMGAIGRGVLPMILRHVKISSTQILVVSARDEEREMAEEHGVEWRKMVLDETNYRDLLKPLLNAGDVFVNVSSCVSSIAVIQLCQEKQVAYIDSSNETWDDSPEVLHLTWGRYVAKEQSLKSRRAKVCFSRTARV